MAAARPNKHHAVEMAAWRRAWTPGTPEWETRRAYPGAAAEAATCDEPACLNKDGGSTAPVTSYWLCPACTARAPDPVKTYKTHAPPAMTQTAIKRQAAAAAAFSAWRTCAARR